MEKGTCTTRFDGISRPRAAIILSLTALAILACIIASRAGKTAPPHLSNSGLSDEEVLYHIIARVHAGENYYDAASDELRKEGFPLRSVFNWRQPLYAWFLGALPTTVIGRTLLSIGAVLTIASATRLALRMGDALMAVIAFWMVTGAVWPCFMRAGLTALETSTAVFITLSFFAYADDFFLTGVMLALIALFIRELAAPYVMVCILLAIAGKRWRELLAWAVGLLFYSGYFTYHVAHVTAHIRPTDLRAASWLQFGGLHFILNTAAQQVLLYGPPLWVTAIYLPIAVLGILAMPGELGRRATLTIAAYLLLFAFVGKAFNDYWGYLYAPLLAFGFAWTPLAIARLCGNRGPSIAGGQRPSVPG
jgi:hypothetical protein